MSESILTVDEQEYISDLERVLGRKIGHEEAVSILTCSWCENLVMHHNACFNSKNLCTDCCDEAGGCCSEKED